MQDDTPSKHFINTGALSKSETYNQDLHVGQTLDARNTYLPGPDLGQYGVDSKLEGLKYHTLSELRDSKQNGAGRRRRKSRRVRNRKRVRKSTRGHKR